MGLLSCALTKPGDQLIEFNSEPNNIKVFQKVAQYFYFALKI